MKILRKMDEIIDYGLRYVERRRRRRYRGKRVDNDVYREKSNLVFHTVLAFRCCGLIEVPRLQADGETNIPTAQCGDCDKRYFMREDGSVGRLEAADHCKYCSHVFEENEKKYQLEHDDICGECAEGELGDVLNTIRRVKKRRKALMNQLTDGSDEEQQALATTLSLKHR